MTTDHKEHTSIILDLLTLKRDPAKFKTCLSPYLTVTMLQATDLTKNYAAFTSLKDIGNRHQVDQYNAQVAKRNQRTSCPQWLDLPVIMQDALAHIAETGLDTFLYFQHVLSSFHRKITGFYFTRLFWDKPILLEDYSKLPTFQMIPVEDRWNSFWPGLGKIALATAIVVTLGFVQMEKDLKLW